MRKHPCEGREGGQALTEEQVEDLVCFIDLMARVEDAIVHHAELIRVACPLCGSALPRPGAGLHAPPCRTD